MQIRKRICAGEAFLQRDEHCRGSLPPHSALQERRPAMQKWAVMLPFFSCISFRYELIIASQHSDWRRSVAALLGRFLPNFGPLETAAFFLV
jgi:hypothetical protein